MEDWKRISLILCTFGFFREFRPSEPFVTEFFTGKWKNITTEQVNRDIFPMGTYSYLAQLILVFLITDILRYKPIIVLSAFVGIVLWSIQVWTYTILGLQFAQICYGNFMAAEIAYYTYIYAKVDREKYQKVSGHTRCAILSGRFTASALGQMIVSSGVMDLRELNYISISSQVVSLFFGLILPSVPISLYFYHTSDGKDLPQIDRKPSEVELTNLNTISEKDKKIEVKFSFKRAIKLLWQHFTSAYTNPKVIEWSIWWSLAMCGFLMIQSYIQLLWKDIDPTKKNFYNGAIEAALTLLGAAASFSAGFLNNTKFQKWDVWILSVCSAIEGGLILWGTYTNQIWVSYAAYVLYGALYHFVITIASAKVATNVHQDSFGLIFGINTLVALILQSFFTIITVTGQVLLLNIRDQFATFGGYYLLLSGLYGIFAIIRTIRQLILN